MGIIYYIVLQAIWLTLCFIENKMTARKHASQNSSGSDNNKHFKKSYLTLTKLIKWEVFTFLFMSHLYFSKIVFGKSLIKLLDIFVDFQIFYGKKFHSYKIRCLIAISTTVNFKKLNFKNMILKLKGISKGMAGTYQFL